MAEFVVEIRPEDWEQRLAQKVRYVVRRSMELTALDLWGGIRAEAPVDHGRLAGSFLLVRLGELAWRIWSPVKYALHVHEGHGVIRPVRARVLRFQVKGGQIVFARMVKAVPPNRFVERAVAMTAAKIAAFGAQAAAEAGG